MQESNNVSSVKYEFALVPTVCPHCQESVTTCFDSKFNEEGRMSKTLTLTGGTDEKKSAKSDSDVMDDTVGVTAKDFDDFRAKVAAADTKLQAKIGAILEEIADIPSCA